MKKNALRIMFVMFWLLALVALPFMAGSANAAPQVLKWGAICPITGPASKWGIAARAAFLMAADDIKKAGGFEFQGQKYIWDVIIYDDEYNPSISGTCATRAVLQDKVWGFYTLGFGTGLGAYNAVKDARPALFFVGSSSAREPLLSKDHPLVFSTYTPILKAADSFYQFMAKKEPGIKTVAFMNPDDEPGNAYPKSEYPAAEARGWTVVANVKFTPRTTDYYPVLTPIVKANPHAIDVGVARPNESGLIIKQARELGYKGIMMTSLGGTPSNDLLSVCPANMLEGFYSAETSDIPKSAKQKHIRERYNEFTSEPFSSVCFNYYDNLYMAIDGIKKANSLDVTKVAEALRGLSWPDHAMGPARFSGAAKYGINCHLCWELDVCQLRNGKYILVGTMPIVDF